MPSKEALFTRDEAARELGVCIRSIDNYVHQGLLQVVRRQRQGRRIGSYIPAAEIERFRRDALTRAEARAAERCARTGAKA